MLTHFATQRRSQSSRKTAYRRHAVLIIDDDKNLSDVLAYRLRKQGLRTVAAHSGKAGLAQAKAVQPSVILMDLCLPDADGLSICEELTDSPETCSVPVIVLSGMDEPGIVRRCRAAGCRYFLRKPYDPNVLLLLIRQAIKDSLF